MIVHFIKVFLAGAFVAAAALRAALSSLGWIDAHTAMPSIHLPSFLASNDVQLAFCGAAGLLVTLWVERARSQNRTNG